MIPFIFHITNTFHITHNIRQTWALFQATTSFTISMAGVEDRGVGGEKEQAGFSFFYLKRNKHGVSCFSCALCGTQACFNVFVCARACVCVCACVGVGVGVGV